MVTLYSLSEEVAAGDTIAWVAEKSWDKVDRVFPKTVTDVTDRGESIQVDAEGIRGGRYRYTVDRNGDSSAFFLNPDKETPAKMGPVLFAELTESIGLTHKKRGYFDSREGR